MACLLGGPDLSRALYLGVSASDSVGFTSLSALDDFAKVIAGRSGSSSNDSSCLLEIKARSEHSAVRALAVG